MRIAQDPNREPHTRPRRHRKKRPEPGWDYIAQDSIDAADRVRDELEAAMTRLCEMPTIGHPRQDVQDKSLRFQNIYAYVIAYRHTRNRLLVARVVSGRRDFKKLFKSR